MTEDQLEDFRNKNMSFIFQFHHLLPEFTAIENVLIPTWIQKQRVAIARALINNPAILFGDEPTGNLDTETTEHVYDLFRQVNKELGTTVLIVTHNDKIAEKSDRVIEMTDGNISRDYLNQK